MKVLFENKSQHNSLRTDAIEGHTENLPEHGKPFMMTAEGLEFGTRLVTTSYVQRIEKVTDNVLEIDTENSKYRITILDCLDEED